MKRKVAGTLRYSQRETTKLENECERMNMKNVEALTACCIVAQFEAKSSSITHIDVVFAGAKRAQPPLKVLG
jgi:hypothetical protein